MIVAQFILDVVKSSQVILDAVEYCHIHSPTQSATNLVNSVLPNHHVFEHQMAPMRPHTQLQGSQPGHGSHIFFCFCPMIHLQDFLILNAGDSP
jgi:hypothetical protein